MERKQILGAFLILALMLLAACAPQSAPSPAPASSKVETPSSAALVPVAPVAKAPAKQAWEVEWEKVVAAAKQEGRVIYYLGLSGEPGTTVAQAFRAKYGIPVEKIGGLGQLMAQKIFNERKAGIYQADVLTTGGSPTLNNFKRADPNIFEPLEPMLILPEVKDSKNWYEGQLSWIDQKEHTIFTSALYPNYPMAINTSLVKPEEIRSWQDLLNPRWKGKILMNDPTIAGVGSSFAAFVANVLGYDYLRALVKQEPVVMRDQRLMFDWLAQGKAAFVVPPLTEVLTTFREAGATVRGVIPEEGTWLAVGISTVSVFNKAPHPNAAIVLVNWLLSKEGQTVFCRAAGYQSARLDVPYDWLPADAVRNPNVKYYKKDTEEEIAKLPEIYQRVGEILAPVMKK